MANITRYNPFRDLIARDWPVRDLFDDWPKDLLPARFFDRDLDIGIKLDVSENDKAYTVRAEVPGVTKEDIKVSVDSQSRDDQRRDEETKGNQGRRKSAAPRVLLRQRLPQLRVRSGCERR